MPGVTACEREPSYLLCPPPGHVGVGGVLGETFVPFTLHFKTASAWDSGEHCSQ